MASTVTDRVDGLSTSVALKAPCKVATTANITLSGLQTINGVSVTTGDRVLVKDQTTGSENGIYVVSSTAWTRALDFNGARDVVKGTAVRIADNSVISSNNWVVTTENPITIGTTAIVFSLIAAEASPTIYESFAAAYAANHQNADSVTIASFHGGWAGTTAGPEGGGTYYRDGRTGTASTAYSSVSGIADNAGFYDAGGVGYSLPADKPAKVTQFGARGRNNTDDVASNTTAFRNAWEFTPAGGTVKIPEGIYPINDVISRVQATAGVSNSLFVEGEGMGSIIRQTAISPDTLFFDANVDQVSGWGLKNISITVDTGATGGHALRIRKFHRGHIENVFIMGAGNRGISIEQCIVNTFTNVNVGFGGSDFGLTGDAAPQNPQYGLVIENVSGVASNTNIFHGCEFTRCITGDGIGVWLKDNGRGNEFHKTVIETNTLGIKVDAQEGDFVFQNVWMESNGLSQVSGATAANPVVITTSAAHGYANDDIVDLLNIGGMDELNERRFRITVVSSTQFSLQDIDGNDVDGTSYTAYTSGGTVSHNYSFASESGVFVQTGDRKWITRPSGEGNNNAVQSITTATDTALTHNQVILSKSNSTVDPFTLASATRVTAAIPGRYRITARASFAANTTGIRRLFFRRTFNGTTTDIVGDSKDALSSGTTDLTASVDLYLEAKDYVEAFVHQTSGGNLNVEANRTITIEFIDYRLAA